MHIVAHRNIYFAIAGILVVLSLTAIVRFGLPLGMDFQGGSLLEVRFPNGRPADQSIEAVFEGKAFGEPRLQTTGDNGLILRMRALSEPEHQEVLSLIDTANEDAPLEELRFESIGPVIGSELKRRALSAIVVTLAGILAYIAFAFRKVSYRLASWKYGVIALIALIHDIVIPTGIFAVLGAFYGLEIDALFISALLTILGFSVHDTIVMFDRVRENLRNFPSKPFADVVEESIWETFARSINTSLTVLIVLAAIFFFGGTSVKYFALALALGTFFGVYSSIFVASPLLVTWESWSKKTS